MTTVYLVRHALAVPRKHWVGEDDGRPLNKRGSAQSQVLAVGVDARHARFDATCVRSMVPIEGSVGDDSPTADDIARGVCR